MVFLLKKVFEIDEKVLLRLLFIYSGDRLFSIIFEEFVFVLLFSYCFDMNMNRVFIVLSFSYIERVV